MGFDDLGEDASYLGSDWTTEKAVNVVDKIIAALWTSKRTKEI